MRAAAADLPFGAGWATSLTIYGASAQLAAIDLLDRGDRPAARHRDRGRRERPPGALQRRDGPHWHDATVGRQALAAYLLVDPSYAVAIDGYTRDLSPADRHRFYLAPA